jgi:hypothetical protein
MSRALFNMDITSVTGFSRHFAEDLFLESILVDYDFLGVQKRVTHRRSFVIYTDYLVLT